MTQPTQTDPVTDYRLAAVERAIVKLTETTEKLVRLEEKHVETRAAIERAFTSIEKQNQRLSKIESEMPKVTLAAGWVFVAVAAIVGAAFAYVWRSSTIPKEPTAISAPQR